MTGGIERAGQLLAVPTAANVLAAFEELQVAIHHREPAPPATARRLLRLLGNALAIRTEALRLRAGTATYASNGHWESPHPRGRLAVKG